MMFKNLLTKSATEEQCNENHAGHQRFFGNVTAAMLWRQSLPDTVLRHVTAHHELFLCDYIINELRDVIARKRPDLSAEVDVFLAEFSYELVVAPLVPNKVINDPKDAPIVNAAILADIDIIISGDKHFLTMNLTHPAVMRVADFWKIYEHQKRDTQR